MTSRPSPKRALARSHRASCGLGPRVEPGRACSQKPRPWNRLSAPARASGTRFLLARRPFKALEFCAISRLGRRSCARAKLEDFGMSLRVSAGLGREPSIFVLHENSTWVEPLRRAFAERDAPFTEWFLDRGSLDLGAQPPQGIFYNRMSASSHTRGHRYAPEYTAAVLAWLTRHGRRIVHRERALQLELSKVAQYQALAHFDIEVPATIAAIGREAIAAAVTELGYPVIVKHNRAGKGLGVKLIYSEPALSEHLASGSFEEPVDGIMLVQRYIAAPAPFITRVEFVGGRLLYAVRVDTSQGFELCPADACQVEAAAAA